MSHPSDTKANPAAPASAAAAVVERDTAVTGTPPEDADASDGAPAEGDNATPPPGKGSPAG
ncbi:hypothetical protein [Sphingomonas montanisoli]|uniref:Uncharacterized protein n=1 Tax=Sphingomonas montanisoli TaxID=2606412 RepID=A0A5D9C2A5_9SPHN|nr:hypothetical protein [Sphingomonas montanisoli]TZG25756.1 hypothetical protein FYJ91_12215 [Sphingomonas montanisoli]